jgi:hypothetical protein
VNFDFSQYIRCELHLFFCPQSHFSNFHFSKYFLNSLSLTVYNKSADFEEDVNHLEVMQHAHYPTGDHVTTPASCNYPQPVHSSTDTETHRTPNMNYTPLLVLTLALVAATGLSLQDYQHCEYSFIIIYLVCAFSVVVFDSHISSDLKEG